MMCSTWKISVFGILALMLAFGMTTDALAQAGTATATITAGGTDLRAAGETTLVFTVSIGTAPQGDNLKTSTVSINIPSVWSRPIVSNDAAITDDGFSVGEVLISDTARGKIVGNRNLVTTFTDGAGADVTFSFKTKVPVRMGTYKLTVSTSGPAFGDPADIEIEVGPIASGGDVFDIKWTGGTLYTEPDTDDNHPYEGNYLIVSKQSLKNLVLTFTAPGTVTKGSVITLTREGLTAWSHADDSEVSVTGNVDVGRPSLTAVTATLKSRVQKGAKVVFTIKNIAEAPEVADGTNAIATGHSLLMQSAIVTDLTADPITPEAAAPTAAQFQFVITKPAGRGALGLNRADTGALTHIVTGAEAPAMGVLTFTWADLSGIGLGSTYEITLPDAWSQPVLLLENAPTKEGAITLAGKVEGRVITGDLTGGDSPAGPAITYNVPKAPAPAPYMFTARATAGRHTSLAPIKAHTVHVTVGHGKGSLALMRGGSVLSQTTSEAPLGNLMFVFTPEGYMASGAAFTITQPTAGAWTAFRVDNGDHIADEGEVTVGPKASIVVGTGDAAGTITVTATEAWTASDRITVTYKNVKAAKTDVPESYTFQGQGQSFAGENLLANLTSSPTIGIGRSPDGGGTLSLAPSQVDAGSAIGNLMVTFTADGNMAAGSTVEVTIPETGGWPAPNDEVGRVTVSSGTLDTTATTMTATTDSDLESGDTIVFTYGNGKLTAPTAGGSYTFSAKSTSSPDGTPTSLTSGVATIQVDEVAAGSIALNSATGPLSNAAPDMDLGNLTFVFTAGAQMASGSEVQVTIPVGWTPAFIDNNDGTDAPGEVSIAGAARLSVSGGGGTPWILTATTNAVLEIGNTLTISYKMVTAPSSEATYEFTTKASVASGGTPLLIKNQPRVIVRTPVAAIALKADPMSVFVGEEIAVTVDLWDSAGELAKALGAQTVVMTSTSDTGEFSNDMGTIPDNMSEWMGTYSDDMAGMATLTATLGEMTSSVDVEIKSGITGKSVDPDPASAGTMITIGATGEADAQASFSYSYVNADGNTVNVQKGMDPVGDPVDGSQMYERSDHALPSDLPEGDVMVTVTIAGRSDSVSFEVINDQDPPTVSNVDASESVVVNGDNFTLSADVAMNASMVAITSVTADLGGLDSTQTDPVEMQELMASPGTYFTIVTVDDANEAEDGEYTITITATDRIGNMGTGMVMVTLENDPSELTSAEVTPGSAKPGETIWIKAMGSAGGDASATVNNAETGMMIAQVTLDEDAANAGMYSAGLMIVEDAHPAGMYDVTVTLGTQMMTLEDALTIEPPGYDFTLSIGAGTHLIHVPLAVTQVNGADMMINTVRDLYNALGDAVNIIISLGADGSWNSYLGDDAPGMAFGDMMLGDSTGLVAVMNSAVTLELTGNALGTGGVSTIMLNAGNNLVGVPLDSAQISMISDVLGTLVSAVVVSNEAGNGFQTITQAGDPGDGPLMGGEGYIVVAAAAASIPVIGSPWQNMMADDGMMSAPPVAFGANVKTPVLHVRGQLVDEAGMMTLDGLTVSVRNVTSGSVLGSGVATDEYSMTFVKLNSSAAKVGDILEIKADSGNPLLGIRPVQHVVTAEDVLNGSISLPDLVTYEIPAQSELLANYPNPFNPETWIPFRLAEDASVSLDIYGASGALVRTIDLGFTPAAVYEGRSDAIYWDGRNNFGEQVSSGLYFYHLRAGEFSATRRMVVVK